MEVAREQRAGAYGATDDWLMAGQIAGTSLLGIQPNNQRMGSYLTIQCEGINEE